MLPTLVGVNRLTPASDGGGSYAPHARGGEPSLDERFGGFRSCSPRSWG